MYDICQNRGNKYVVENSVAQSKKMIVSSKRSVMRWITVVNFANGMRIPLTILYSQIKRHMPAQASSVSVRAMN